MNNLRFPSFRIVDDVTPDEQLGKYSPELWEKVENDIYRALLENSETYSELEERYFR